LRLTFNLDTREKLIVKMKYRLNEDILNWQQYKWKGKGIFMCGATEFVNNSS
jgi:hypothetical protein